MAIAKAEMEGHVDIAINIVVCKCVCGHVDKENATIEINFQEQKVFYSCSKCKKMNTMQFGKQSIPMPRTTIGR